MFKKLRNKLILINLSITTVVILVVFSTIYALSLRAANNRPPIPEEMAVYNENSSNGYTEDMRRVIMVTVREEKEAAAENLLITLIVSGVTVELAVLIISYILAEQAIRPVREAYESQKIFIANASHEIKTPLAAISANLEAADIKNNRWIANVEAETARLTSLNNELLALARTDLVRDVVATEVNLKEMINQSLEVAQARLGEKRLVRKIKLRARVKVNSADWMQIFNILLDNAIKYSDKLITVQISDRLLIIENDGKTIAKEDLTRVFERFYQTDKTAEGVGLGLSIAKSLAERNRWRLTASCEAGRTKFILDY